MKSVHPTSRFGSDTVDVGSSFFSTEAPVAEIRGSFGTYRLLRPVTSHGKYGRPFIVVDDNGTEYFLKMMDADHLGSLHNSLRQQYRAKIMPAYSYEYEILTHITKHNPELAVPKVFDHGLATFTINDEVLSVPFIVYEYLQGFDLSTTDSEQQVRIRADILTSELFPSKILRLIETLRNLHSIRILHGDIHPGNIMCIDPATESNDRHNLMLIDFGQAFVLDRFYAQTLHDKSSDHPYTAPERLKRMSPNQSNALSTPVWQGQADIFSLGATILSVLTQWIPSAELRAVSSDRTAYIDGLLTEHCPDHIRRYPGLQQVLAKATEPKLDRRYQTMADFQADWKMIVCGERAGLPEEQDVKSVVGSYREISRRSNPIDLLILEDFIEMRHKAEQIVRANEYVEHGSRDEMIRKLFLLISSCSAGDTLVEYSGSYVWHPHNLGHNGRYHAAVQRAVDTGADLWRICDVSAEMGAVSPWTLMKERIGASERVHIAETQKGWPDDSLFTIHGLIIVKRSGKPLVIDVRFELMDTDELESGACEVPQITMCGFRVKSNVPRGNWLDSEWNRVFQECFGDSQVLAV